MATQNLDNGYQSLTLIEAQCEASLWRNPKQWNNDKGRLISIRTALNCPNGCHENGKCVNDACICDQGFSGFDCRIKTDAPKIIKLTTKVHLCDKRTDDCGQIPIEGTDFVSDLTCQGRSITFLDRNKIVCHIGEIENLESEEVVIKLSNGADFNTEIVVRLFDSACENCEIHNGQSATCKSNHRGCWFGNACHQELEHHPNDKCLQCSNGQWINIKAGRNLLVTSELNKKFKVLSGDVFSYQLPKIEGKFDLVSGPFGANLSDDSMLTWRATSNLIADSWTELFVLKVRGSCHEESTLVEITVQVVPCDCLNGATCILVHDELKCQCKPGYKGKFKLLSL